MNGGDRAPGTTFTHQFSTPGSYGYVCRIHPDKMRGTVTVTAPVTPPSASFTVAGQAAPAGSTVTFDASASTVAAGRTVAAHTWDLDGDGSFETSTGTSPIAIRVYSDAASLTVRLRVTDSASQSAEATRSLSVAPGRPTASFTASDSAPIVGAAVAFDASSSSAVAGRTVVSYEWDLDGDGIFEVTTAGSQRTYLAPGPVTVRLRITDSAGLRGETARLLQVVAPQIAAPAPSSGSGSATPAPQATAVAPAVAASAVVGLRLSGPSAARLGDIATTRARCARSCALIASARLLIAGGPPVTLAVRITRRSAAEHDISVVVPAARRVAARSARRAGRSVRIQLLVRVATGGPSSPE